MVRTAAILIWAIAVGFGLPAPLAMRTVLAGRGLPLIFGIRAYGNGPFERLPPQSFVTLLVAFMLLCALEIVVGWLLWSGHKAGGILALALLPVGAVFWWGFALPIPPMFGIVRTFLIVAAWRSLR